jgi:hypothetical protein
VSAGKTPYVHFDRNNYSLPHTFVRRMLTVFADPRQVRIVDGGTVLACPQRSYHKGVQIEDPMHVLALTNEKHAARRQRGNDRLPRAAPASQT